MTKRDLASSISFFALLVLFLAGPGSVRAASPAPAPPGGMVNLVQGKAYTVTSLVSTTYSFAPREAKYRTAGALTDGIIGSSTNFADGVWQGYDHGGARSVTIDMGRVNSVHQLQERFFNDPSSGVYFPRRVKYALSMNDTDWSVVGTVGSQVPSTSSEIGAQTYALSGLNYQARYVRMTFTVDIWVFADEFQVFGNTGVQSGAVIPPTTPPVVYPDAYLPPGSPKVAGIRNMVLIYNGYYPSDSTTGLNSVNELLPYVGYESTDGTIKDFMFDSFLFLPFVAAGGPSGGKYYCSTAHPTVKSDWVYYLDNTFSNTYNLAALNRATASVKKILDSPDYRAKVEIAIPYPTPTATDFGEINGKAENLSLLSDREDVIRWYIDDAMSRWKSAGYTDLDLVGFYWYEEGADFDVDDSEAAMLRYTGDYVRSLGKVFTWIPAYQSSGFEDWDSLGFDGAIMQPNYVFDNFQEPELGEAADASRKLGMGVELEIHWNATKDSTYRAKYYAYLNYGVSKGYMKGAVHAYYQNGGPGTFYDCCTSTDPQLREIYDQTYRFIKGTYDGTATAVLERPLRNPGRTELGANYPNPFNPSTVINVGLRKTGVMSLKIYDVLGQLVKVVDSGYKPRGLYTYDVNMNSCASGVYFYTLREGATLMTRKMILLR